MGFMLVEWQPTPPGFPNYGNWYAAKVYKSIGGAKLGQKAWLRRYSDAGMKARNLRIVSHEVFHRYCMFVDYLNGRQISA